ncbi:phage portal protein [Mariniphaga sediminis]|uniref:phage portal protein n=1 Tax=Mariniphaga sediminis TaxID=1628158 RepID=UPI0035641849
MGILSWFGKRGVEVYDDYTYDVKSIGNLIVPEKLTDKNAFNLANSVSEIYFPVDFYADRISKLRFYIANKSGREVVNTELNRFITDRINPLYSFSDLVYQYVFSLLSDGNAINYLGVPSIYTGNPSTNNIERWDVLQPNLVSIDEYTNQSVLNIGSWNDMIRKAYYDGSGVSRSELTIKNMAIHNYGMKKRSSSYVLSKSPLYNANKSIDVLLAVYSARYNVYANNGAAGYLSRKVSGSSGQNAAFEAAIMDGSKRDEIIQDINERNGLTGRKNIWGISGIPIEFIKTLATIKDLMPMDETLENSIKIASVFQIPPVLVPRKDQSTYDNQENAERNVWENGLLSMAKTVSNNLTKMFGIDKVGSQIMFDTSNVSALTENKSEAEDLTMKQLQNVEKLKQINPELDITPIVNEIYSRYGTED